MKKMFYLLGLFLLLIPFKVKAVTIGSPSSVTIRADGQFRSEKTHYTSGAWGLSGYATDWLSNGGGAPIINSIWFHYPNLHQCANEDAMIKGKFFTTTNTGNQIFRDVIIQYEDSQTGSYSRCTVYPDQSRGNDVVDFICSGINAYSGNFVLSYLSQVPSDTSSMFQVAISNNLEVSCSPNNGTIINNQNQNTQDIINNNNQNTNEIKNSIASMGSSINSNIDSLKEKQDETNNYLKDDTPPESDISSLGNVQGLLPPGPVDSLLNIPFYFLSIVTSSFGGVCTPLTGNFVFDTELSIPCFSEIIYNDIPSGIMVFINLIPTTFLLIVYFKHLYKKVSRAVSLETTGDDEWGVL